MFTGGDNGVHDSDPFASCDEELEKNELVVYDDYVKTNLTCTHSEQGTPNASSCTPRIIQHTLAFVRVGISSSTQRNPY